MKRGAGTPWLNCFPKVTNGELRGLYQYPFTSPIQIQIVLFVLAQTRGTGRLTSGAVEPSQWQEWQDALASYGRETFATHDSRIASHLQRDPHQIARERRRLISAGILVEHERGHRGKEHVLSVDLDPLHWRQLPARKKGERLRQKGGSSKDKGSQMAPENAESGAVSGSQMAPDTGSHLAPENAESGSQMAPPVKRVENTSCSFEQETCDSRAAQRRDSHDVEGFTRAADVLAASIRSRRLATAIQQSLTQSHGEAT